MLLNLRLLETGRLYRNGINAIWKRRVWIVHKCHFCQMARSSLLKNCEPSFFTTPKLVKMRRLSANQRKFIIERIVMGLTIHKCQISFKKVFDRLVSKTDVQKIMRKLRICTAGDQIAQNPCENVEKVSDVL